MPVFIWIIEIDSFSWKSNLLRCGSSVAQRVEATLISLRLSDRGASWSVSGILHIEESCCFLSVVIFCSILLCNLLLFFKISCRAIWISLRSDFLLSSDSKCFMLSCSLAVICLYVNSPSLQYTRWQAPTNYKEEMSHLSMLYISTNVSKLLDTNGAR